MKTVLPLKYELSEQQFKVANHQPQGATRHVSVDVASDMKPDDLVLNLEGLTSAFTKLKWSENRHRIRHCWWAGWDLNP